MIYTHIPADPKTLTKEHIARENLDGSISMIPIETANSDYQRYLAWLENPEAEQSTPPVIE
jgi:hypothetical protein